MKLTRQQETRIVGWPEVRDRRNPWVILAEPRFEVRLCENIFWCGRRIWRRVLKREDVPMWAFVSWATSNPVHWKPSWETIHEQ